MEDKKPDDASVEAETYFRIWGEFPSPDPHKIERIRAKANSNSVAKSSSVGSEEIAALLSAIEPLLLATTEKLTSIDSRLSTLEAEMKELNNRTEPDGS